MLNNSITALQVVCCYIVKDRISQPLSSNTILVDAGKTADVPIDNATGFILIGEDSQSFPMLQLIAKTKLLLIPQPSLIMLKLSKIFSKLFLLKVQLLKLTLTPKQDIAYY